MSNVAELNLSSGVPEELHDLQRGSLIRPCVSQPRLSIAVSHAIIGSNDKTGLRVSTRSAAAWRLIILPFTDSTATRSRHGQRKDQGRLKDPSLLPSNLKNSRILTYGYNATVTAVFGKTSSDRILQHAHTLVAQLVADREVCLVGRMELAMVTEIEQISWKMRRNGR
jgi:hypothetical protein